MDVLSITELFDEVINFLSVTDDYFTFARVCKYINARIQDNLDYKNLVDFISILKNNNIHNLRCIPQNILFINRKQYPQLRRHLLSYINGSLVNIPNSLTGSVNKWEKYMSIASKLNHPIHSHIIKDHNKHISQTEYIRAYLIAIACRSHNVVFTIDTHNLFNDLDIQLSLMNNPPDPNDAYEFFPDDSDDDDDDDENTLFSKIMIYLCDMMWDAGDFIMLEYLIKKVMNDDTYDAIVRNCENWFVDCATDDIHNLQWLRDYYLNKFECNLFNEVEVEDIDFEGIITCGYCTNLLWYYDGLKAVNKEYNIHAPSRNYQSVDNQNFSLFEYACTKGNLKIVQLLYILGESSETHPKLDLVSNYVRVFKISLLSHNIEIVKYIYDLINTAHQVIPCSKNQVNPQRYFDTGPAPCSKDQVLNLPNPIYNSLNQIFTCEIIHNVVNIEDYDDYDDYEIYKTNFVKSFLEWTMFELKCPIEIKIPFRKALNLNLKDILMNLIYIHKLYERLHNNNPNRIEYNLDLHSGDGTIIADYISEGNCDFNILKWLVVTSLSEGLGMINLRGNSDAAFKAAIVSAAVNDNTLIVNGLCQACIIYDLGCVDIHTDNDAAFRKCCLDFKTHYMAKCLYNISRQAPYTPIQVPQLKDQIMSEYTGKLRRMLEKFLMSFN